MSTFVPQSGFNTRIATDTVRHAVYRCRTITRSDRNTYYGGSGWDKGPENNHALITVAPGEVPAEIATADQRRIGAGHGSAGTTATSRSSTTVMMHCG